MENQPILIQRIFQSPALKVWTALTDKKEMKKWYFDLAEFKAEKGFRFQFPGGPDPEKPYLHLCEVTAVIPLKKLTYSWRYDGYPGISYITFELEELGDRTLLKFMHEDIDTFPKENPDLAKANFIKGWDQIINTSLREYLEGKNPGSK